MDSKILNTMDFHKILAFLAKHAATGLGEQAALKLRPSSDFEEVKRRLQATDEAMTVERLKGGPPLAGVKDIRGALKRARIQAMLSSTELWDISALLFAARRTKRHIAAVHEEEAIPLLHDLADTISDQKQLEEDIRQCIDEQGEILDQASFELAAIRRELRIGETRIREKLESMIRSSNAAKMLQEQLITIRNDRYVIPVKQEYRSHYGGIVHDQSGSGATLFIEPEAIVAMNNKLRETKLREEREIERILSRLTEQIGWIADVLEYDTGAVETLDFMFAKARLAREMKASLPRMNDRGFLKLRKARHPLIPADQVVPIDVELGNSYTSILITGPNTGGKTVTLKTIGLLNLMAMSGLFIPAEDGSQMCVFDAIYADIGDEQSIEQSLSTFSSHLTNIIRILEQMTPKSLVLLDEVGAGTDPAEGSALAIAILEHIHRLGCRMVATTHYSELKAYAYERKGVINASMEFDIQTLRPTYRLLVGVPGRSNAFAIAERLGLPKPIIDHARGEVTEEDMRVETMIASLEDNRLKAEAERETASKLRMELEAMRQKLARELEKQEAEREKRQQQAEEKARAIVDKARREAQEIIAELRQLAMEGVQVKEHMLTEARKRLDEAAPEAKLAAKPKRDAKPVRRIEAGDDVRVYSLNQKGSVVELVGEEAVVQLGIMKMKVPLDDLELLSSAKTAAKTAQSGANVKRTRGETVRSELDLRGANLEEALMEVDRFLDEALLGNLGQVYIIHGKGTGILRSGIQEFLRKHKHVKSFRLGSFGEGGTGVTVAELK
ncbi:endonuclease MutS2 [Paenibacillus melissococcoides]|uniref:Endonuclease MutS2 n=1 Tax=Paenibacillus melissococcoides TaxID=2912268 RepID=A0ABN8U8M6_9BACL|nr:MULTISPECIES: endonuclease MutS2 [Paenibacillus]MEB9895059.1 endonuclease MutS2 [Bacillus cereus]CAH8246148.1 endonuclease MutS2 [Paenibacillus melissococcoides]CAH8713108.1 endonuclease MutS2 [Paenibacillus melissococcoides]CAH8713843.1 endonuclease MutS2 [Paenibacillus melissococcoides]GIO80290.1 endonuclease MutS2 [Paenibacillus dendritiformis]